MYKTMVLIFKTLGWCEAALHSQRSANVERTRSMVSTSVFSSGAERDFGSIVIRGGTVLRTRIASTYYSQVYSSVRCFFAIALTILDIVFTVASLLYDLTLQQQVVLAASSCTRILSIVSVDSDPRVSVAYFQVRNQ
jgi:hypothetical protein